MCSPTLALVAVGTAFSAFSQMQQASAQAAAVEAQARDQQIIANYNAQIAENNAGMDYAAAKDAVVRGANEAGDARTRLKQINATARANQASTGIMVDQGSQADVIDQNMAFGEADALNIVNNAEREAYGFETSAVSNINSAATIRAGGQAQVNAARASAANIKHAGLLNAGSTLITGAVQYGKLGGFGGGSSSGFAGAQQSNGINWWTDRNGKYY